MAYNLGDNGYMKILICVIFLGLLSAGCSSTIVKKDGHYAHKMPMSSVASLPRLEQIQYALDTGDDPFYVLDNSELKRLIIDGHDELALSVLEKRPEIAAQFKNMYSAKEIAERYYYFNNNSDDGEEKYLKILHQHFGDAEYQKAAGLISRAKQINSINESPTEKSISEKSNIRVKVLKIGGDEVRVLTKYDSLYKLKGANGSAPKDLVNVVKVANGHEEIANTGYFKFGGNAVKSIEKPSGALYYDSLSKSYGTTKPGKAVLTASIGASSIDLTFTVVEIPVKRYAPVDDLVKALGIPTNKNEYTFTWPCGGSVNGYIYSPAANSGGIRVEHWVYDKYPGAIFEILNDEVNDVIVKVPAELDPYGDHSCY
jgi:hypothetical protein